MLDMCFTTELHPQSVCVFPVASLLLPLQLNVSSNFFKIPIHHSTPPRDLTQATGRHMEMDPNLRKERA